MTRPRLLVLGGTGRLAGMVRRWDSGCADITWVARQGHAALSSDCHVFDTRTDPAALARACDAADVILDLSGPTTNPDRGATSYEAIPTLARAVAHAAQGKPVLWMSSAAVYGPRLSARESDPLHPVSAYGRAKSQGEAILQDCPGVTRLRLGNVAGADALLGQSRPGVSVVLDQFADGATPMRAYIGPKSLVKSLFFLVEAAAQGRELPAVLNIAAPGSGVAMGDLLSAARLEWQPRPAPEGALRALTLNTQAFLAHVPLPAETGTPAGIVAEWRADRALMREGGA
jgi:nucleoside-diphosphate-sugar epimerase